MSIIVALTTWSITILALDGINPDVIMCYVSSYPYGCNNRDDIECERGVHDDDVHLTVQLIVNLLIVPLTIIGSTL